MRNIVVKHFSPSKRRVLRRQLGTQKARLAAAPILLLRHVDQVGSRAYAVCV